MGIVGARLQCELREVILRDKPAEMIAISPKGTVPVLELPDGTVIDESLDIMLWALERDDPEFWLQPESGSADSALELVQRTELEFKPHLDRYKYPNRYPEENAAEQRTLATRFIRLLEDRLESTPNLFGVRACIADIAIFPFVRQFANTDRDWFDDLPYRRTQNWLTTLTDSTLFATSMQKYNQWQTATEGVQFPNGSRP